MFLLMLGVVLGTALCWALSRHHARYAAPPSLPSLLQWAALPRDGILWLKDGAFMATWEYRGPDLNFATVEQMDTLARQFNRALLSLGKQHMLHLDCCRVPSTSYTSGNGFASSVGALLDELSRAGYAAGMHFENRYFMTLTLMPPEEIYQKLSRVLIEGEEGTGIDWEAELDHFEALLRAFEDLLPKQLSVKRLGSSELLSYLSYLLKGSFYPVNVPPEPDFIEAIFDEEFRPGFEPVLGGTYHRVVSIQGYPDESFMGILQALDDLDYPYRYSTRIIGTDPDEITAMIKKRMQRWFQKREGGKDLLEKAVQGKKAETHEVFLNAFADEQALDAQHAYKDAQAGLVRHLNHTACVVVRHDRREVANDRARRVQKVFSHRGFITTVETGNATEALLGSLPGHGHQNVRRVPIRSDYITRLLPLSCVYAGPHHNPCKLYGEDSPVLFYAETAESVPFRFTPYVGQVGHTIIVGPTGSGKSILMGYEGYRHQQYANAQTILFDNGNSFALLCEVMNGKRFEVGHARLGFQPLRDVCDPEERRWAADWISTLVELQGVEMTPSRRRMIVRTLEHMAERAQHNLAFLTMAELETQLQEQSLKDALAPYAGAGAMGQLLNADHDSLQGTRFQVFELSSIIDLSAELVTPVLLYIFHRIQQMLDPERPTFVGADEFFLFAAKSEAGRRYCVEALRSYRKHNAMLTIATQDPADLIPSDHGDDLSAVLNSCRTRIYLPNPDALEPSQLEMYLQHGLNEHEIKEIADAVPQRDYISRQPTGTRRFNLGLRAELAFMTPLPGHSMLKTAHRLREVKAECGERWLHAWLLLRGYPKEAARALEAHHLARARLEVPGNGKPLPLAPESGHLAEPTSAQGHS